MPAHAEALNERSSMPPMSVTIQALKLAPPAPVELDEADEELDEGPAPVELDELEAAGVDLDPQPAAARATTAAAAAILVMLVVRTGLPLADSRYGRQTVWDETVDSVCRHDLPVSQF